MIEPANINCPVCGSGVKFAIKICDVEHKTRQKCKICDCIYIDGNNIIKPLYDLEYNQYFLRPLDIQKAGMRACTIAIMLQTFRRETRFLEVGAGNGLTSHLLQLQGYNVTVAEEHRDTCQYLSRQYLLKTIQGQIEDAKIKSRYELIYASHVLEHSSRPLKFMIKLQNLLAENGKIFIDTPNTDRALHGDCTWKHFNTRQPHEHLSLFNYKSFKMLANRAGLKIVNFKEDDRHDNIEFILQTNT